MFFLYFRRRGGERLLLSEALITLLLISHDIFFAVRLSIYNKLETYWQQTWKESPSISWLMKRPVRCLKKYLYIIYTLNFKIKKNNYRKDNINETYSWTVSILLFFFTMTRKIHFHTGS